MPQGVDEAVWRKAKQAAAEAGEAGNHPYVMAVYQRMIAGKTRKAFVSLYGLPTVEHGAHWIAEVSDLSGVPVADLYKAYRWGRAHASVAVPPRPAGQVCVYELALKKATKPPPGYTRAPGSRIGAYRKKSGRRWVYWRPSGYLVSTAGLEPAGAGETGQGQLQLPIDSSPPTVGPVHRSMPLDEVETAISGLGIEHLVAYVGDAQVHRALGTEKNVAVSRETIQAWRTHGEVVVTHNHPTSAPLSSEDIILAVAADLREIRAVTASGGAWVLRRPPQGWGHPDGVEAIDVQRMLDFAQRESAQRAGKRMDAIVRAAGGDTNEGARAVGYDESVWREIWTEEWAGSLNRAFRRGFYTPKLDWTLEYQGPPNFDWQRDRSGPVVRGDGIPVSSEARKGLRDIVRLSAPYLLPTEPVRVRTYSGLVKGLTPPPGYSVTPGSKIGTFRKWSGTHWDYWKPGDTTSAETRQLSFADVRSNGRQDTSHPDAKPAGRVATHYYSGMSRTGNIAAFGRERLPIGVAIQELSANAVEHLDTYYGDQGVPVFVDSGAYSEFSIPLKIRARAEKAGRELTPKEQREIDRVLIPDSEWDVRLAKYEAVARVLGRDAVFVAPDKVADQTETLRRMSVGAERMYDITAFGSKVLVPLQGGDMSISEFAPLAYDALGADMDRDQDVYIPAFPMNGGALGLAEVAEYLRTYKPPRVHFLGIGLQSVAKDPETGERVIDGLQRAVREHSPDTVVTIDSNVLASKSGSTGGKGGGPRPATIALQDAKASLLAEAAPRVDQEGSVSIVRPAGTEAVSNALGAPKVAFTRSQLRRVAEQAGITSSKERGRFADDPMSYRARDTETDGKLTRYLERLAWRVYYAEPRAQETHARQVSQVFQEIDRPEEAHWAKSLAKNMAYNKPPPGYTATPGSKIGTFRKWSGTHWDYWKPGQPALHARMGHGGAPKPGEKGYIPEPDRGDSLDGRSSYDVAERALSSAMRLLDDSDLHTILDPDWQDEWDQRGSFRTDSEPDVAEERADLIEMGELAEHLAIPRKGPSGEPWTQELRSDLAHQILELAMAAKHGFESPDHIPPKYQQYGAIPKWAAVAALADDLESQYQESLPKTQKRRARKLRLVLVTKDEAQRFIERHHSALPYLNPRGLIYAIGVKRGDRLVAVATAGHPTANWGDTEGRGSRSIDPRNVVELTRVASDGTTLGASSKLVGRLIDILGKSKRGDPDAPALFVTYQLTTESGTTYEALRDKGLRPVVRLRGTTPHGARSGGGDTGDLALAGEDKIRWEAGPAALEADWSLVRPSPQQSLFKALTPPPGQGWTPIPNSKSSGWHRRVAGKFVQWYPKARAVKRRISQQIGLFTGRPEPLPDAGEVPGRETRPEVTIMSMGLGRDSVTMLCLAKEGKLLVDGEYLSGDDLDGIVFSDPGWEWPHTYALIPRIKEMCEEMNVPFIHLRKSSREGPSGWEIYHAQRALRTRARADDMQAFADAGLSLADIGRMKPAEARERLAPLIHEPSILTDVTRDEKKDDAIRGSWTHQEILATRYRASARRQLKQRTDTKVMRAGKDIIKRAEKQRRELTDAERAKVAQHTRYPETDEEHAARLAAPLDLQSSMVFDPTWVREARYLPTIEERAEAGFYHRRAPIMEDYGRLCKITLRENAACTANHKIIPVNDRLTNDLLVEKFGIGKNEWTAAVKRGERPLNRVLIGIAADETHRLAGAEAATQSAKHIRPHHPLVDMGITKAGEAEILERHGLGHVRKSGCMGCHFQPVSWYWALRESQPVSYQQIIDFEGRAIQYAVQEGLPVKYLRGTKPIDEQVSRWREKNPEATVDAVLDKDYTRPKKGEKARPREIILEDDGNAASAYESLAATPVRKALDYWQYSRSALGREALVKAGGPYIGPRGGKWADPQHTISWKERDAPAVENPVVTKLYGGIPSAGGFGDIVEFGVGLGNTFEAAHCILGSLGRNLGGRSDDTAIAKMFDVEQGHLDEEMSIIRRNLREYSRQIYRDQMTMADIEHYKPEYRDRMRDAARRQAEDIRTSGARLSALTDSLIDEFISALPTGALTKQVTSWIRFSGATYSFIRELSRAAVESVARWPEEVGDPFSDKRVRKAFAMMETHHADLSTQHAARAARDYVEELSDLLKARRSPRPPGTGWMPTPKTRIGSWRRKDKHGNWEYWKPEDVTGQAELFAPRPQRKRLPTDRLPQLRRELLGDVKQNIADVKRDGSDFAWKRSIAPWMASEDRVLTRPIGERKGGMESWWDRLDPDDDYLLQPFETGPYPSGVVWYRAPTWRDDLQTYFRRMGHGEAVSTPTAFQTWFERAVELHVIYTETRDARNAVRRQGGLPELKEQSDRITEHLSQYKAVAEASVREMGDPDSEWMQAEIERIKTGIDWVYRQEVKTIEGDARPGDTDVLMAEADARRSRALEAIPRWVSYMSEQASAILQDPARLASFADYFRFSGRTSHRLTQTLRDTYERVVAAYAPESRKLDHWGSAESGNAVANATAWFGDHGLFRPVDRNMADTQLAEADVQSADYWLAGAHRYLYAQEQISQTSRDQWPTVYRGMGLRSEVLASIEAGTHIPMTGCTAFAFNRATAEHYAESEWTQRNSPHGAVGVVIEIERDDEFDSTVAGWHPDKGRSGSPAYEIVSGINRIEVTEVLPGVDHDRLAGMGRRRHLPDGTIVREGAVDPDTQSGREWLAGGEDAQRMAAMLKRDGRSVGTSAASMATSYREHVALGRVSVEWALGIRDDPRSLVRMTEEEVRAAVATDRLSAPIQRWLEQYVGVYDGSQLPVVEAQEALMSMYQDHGGYWRLEGGDFPPGAHVQSESLPEGSVIAGRFLRSTLKEHFPERRPIIRGRGVVEDPDELTKARAPRPPGTGWMPTPKTRIGSWRRKDKRGNWEYWKPEDETVNAQTLPWDLGALMHGEYAAGTTTAAELVDVLTAGAPAGLEEEHRKLTERWVERSWDVLETLDSSTIPAVFRGFERSVTDKLLLRQQVQQEVQQEALRDRSVDVVRAADRHRRETDPGPVSTPEEGADWAAGGVLHEPLYHATLAGRPIMETGIRVREDMDYAQTLGGGPDNAISTTPSLAGARKIAAVFAALSEAYDDPDSVRAWFDEHWLPHIPEGYDWAHEAIASSTERDPVSGIIELINKVSYLVGTGKQRDDLLVPWIGGKPARAELQDIGFVTLYAHVDAVIGQNGRVLRGPSTADAPANIQVSRPRDAKGRPDRGGEVTHFVHGPTEGTYIEHAHVARDTENRAEQGEIRVAPEDATSVAFEAVGDWRSLLMPREGRGVLDA
jgi:hypothetical protein